MPALNATRQPDLRRFYRRELKPIPTGSFEFLLRFQTPGSRTATDITDLVESFSWQELDSQSGLQGNLQLKRPVIAKRSSLAIRRADLLTCLIKRGGTQHRNLKLWTMRAGSDDGSGPETSLSDGEVTLDGSDAFAAFDRNRREWAFRKTKTRPHGWYAHEIAHAVARAEGWRLGPVARGTHRMTLVRHGDNRCSGWRMIQAAYAKEQSYTARIFVTRVQNGQLCVFPFRRNRILYTIEELLTEAMVREYQASIYTILHAHGYSGKGKNRKSHKITVRNQSLVDRFGEVEEEWNAGRVTSSHELSVLAKRRYAKITRVRRTATLTIPGNPFIRLLDGVRWITDEAGWHGATTYYRDRSFAYVTSVSNTVNSDGYTTELEIAQDDIYQIDKERRESALRAKAAARRKAKR